MSGRLGRGERRNAVVRVNCMRRIKKKDNCISGCDICSLVILRGGNVCCG